MNFGTQDGLWARHAAQLRPTAFAFAFGISVPRAFGADASEKLPELLPPHGELPAGFWDLYTWHVVAGACLLLGLLALALWWWARPRTSPAPPAADTAREALTPLVPEEETGPILSRVSQVVRRYFGSVFGLPPGEMTTAEFARAVQSGRQAEPDLGEQAVKLLRACDERKFAPSPSTAPLRAASEALHLINESEARRARALATQPARFAERGADTNGKEAR